MRKQPHSAALAVLSVVILASCAFAQSPELKAKAEAKAKQLEPLGTDPTIVEAVRAFNTAVPPSAAAMTNEQWKTLSQLDPAVRAYSKNALAMHMKSKIDPAVSEWFISASGGAKIAFQAKPRMWSESTIDRHQLPMTGTLFIGPVEVDEANGQYKIQVGIPILDAGRPIGVIIAGIPVRKL